MQANAMVRYAVVLALVLPSTAIIARRSRAAEEKPEKVTYADHVRPIFREHCFSCHNQTKAQNDLAVDTYEKLMAGGASGEVVEPGDPDASYLWGVISHADEPRMPPNQDKLPEVKLAVIKRWIESGALKDSGSKSKAPKRTGLALAPSSGGQRPEGPAILPEGLLREPVVYTPRAGAITALASSPWAPVVAVSGQKQVALYHSDEARLLGVVPFAEGIPQIVRFSRSGALMLVGGGKGASRGLVAVHDVKSGKRLFTVGDELDTVLAADINDTQTHIALGGPQRIVRVYSTETGSLAYEITKHTDWIYAAAFSPDGVLLATADRSGGLHLWEAQTGREYLNLEGHKGGVTDVSWRADSNVLASASDDGTVKLWNVMDGKQLKSVAAHGGGVTAVEFTHDGRFVTAGRDKTAKAWDATGKQLRAFPALKEPALEATFTHDGQRVVAGDWSGEVRMWKADDGSQVALLPANPPTLAMRIEEARKTLAAAQQASGKAAAELAQAEKALADRQSAHAGAMQEAVRLAEDAAKARAAAEDAKKALAQAKDNQDAAKKALADAEAAAGKAADAAAGAKQTADRIAAELAELRKQRDARAPTAAATAQAAADAQAALDALVAEAAAVEKAR